jgi:hypothetical protein
MLLVPRTGLVVAAEGVCFEDVDFVWNHAAELSQADLPGAIVELRCGRGEFHGCSFRWEGHALPPIAIRWMDPLDARDPTLSLPSGRLVLKNCALCGVDAGIACQVAGALTLELTNTLYLGSGPLVRLDHCPKPDEPVSLALAQVTLRDAGPLLECRCEPMADPPGEISIRATGCAFVPTAGAPLLLLSGPVSPEPLLGNMRWTGQGSLVSPATVIAAWRRPDGSQQAMDDGGVSIAGLVRSEVGFAGESRSRWEHSRIIRWQVPLQSADPPGIDPGQLPRQGP